LQGRLLMFYTGNTRLASDILINQKNNTETNKNINYLHKIVGLAKDLHTDLSVGRIDTFGNILDAGWKYKKEIASGISNDEINKIYDHAIENGAEGGKLLGAGGGGFLLFYVKEENQYSVRRSLRNLTEFKFEFENIGSTIIYYN